MRQMATKRVWLLLLAVVLLCALLVFPAAAETEEEATFRLTFQSASGGELGENLESGTVITARLLTEHPIDLTTAQLTVQVDSSKLVFVNEGTNKKDKYASSEMRDDDGLLFNFEHNVISADSAQKLKVVATSSDTQTWVTDKALVYFKLKVTAAHGMQTSELPDLVQFSGKNNRDTTDGKDATFVAKDVAENPVTYISDYNVCPYAQAMITEGQMLWSTATIADLKQRIEVTQYSAGGTASTGMNPTCTLYTAGSSTPLADTAMLRTVSASQLTGTLTGGIKFTLGDLSDWIQEDEIAAIRLSTTETVKTEYTYGDVFDPTGVTVTGDYLSGKSEPIDLSKVTYNKQPLKRSDTAITFEYQRKRIALPITVNPKRLDSAKFATYTLDDHVYTGSAIEPKPDLIYQDGGDTTIAPAEYDLSYSNNTNAGTATVTFTCKADGNYSFDPVQRNFTIRKKTLTLLDVRVQSRVYDGTKTATVESFRGSVSGFVSGDNITIDTSSATATLDSADAGTRTATITGITTVGGAGGNYEIAQPLKATVEITPYIIQNPQFKQGNTTKTYDGTTNVASNFYMALSGASMLPGEQADMPLVVQSAAYTSSDAADSATIQVQLKQLVGNYRLADDQLNATVAGKITPMDVGSQTITRDAITVTLGDGTFTEHPNTVAIGTQSVTLGAWTYQMDANEAPYTYTDLVNHLKTLPVGEHTITATAAATGNYTGTVQYSTTLYVKDIEFKVGSAEATFANAFTKITDEYTGGGFASYFQSNAVTATLAEQSVAGTFTVYVDDVAADAAQSSLSADTHTVVLKFSSTDGNYRNEVVCSGTFTIQPKELTVTGGITVDSRVYDGTPDFAVSQVHTTGAQLRGVCSGDAVTVQAVSIAQAGTGDANFGDKPVVITLKAMSGAAENSNYTVKDYSATAEITCKPVTITGTTVKNRAYDGTTVVEIENAGTLVGLIAADEGKVSVDTGRAHATASDKNVGTRTVTFTSFSINGSGTKNYTLKEQPAATTVQISQKSLTPTVVVDDKDFDGTTNAAATVTLSGVVVGDVVSAQGDAAFASADAGTDKAVTCTGMTLSGKDAGNYQLSTNSATVYATIRAAAPTGAPTFSSVTAANTPTGDVSADADGFCGVQGENLTGTVTVDWEGDTTVRANYAYRWTFTPNSANYTTCSGTAVLYRVNSGYSQQVKDQAEKFEAEKNGEVIESDVPTFRDVRTGDYYYDAVQWAVENGITTGQSAKRFAPGAACSRAQVMTMLWRAMGQPESTQTVTLTDVRQNDYYREAVSWALENDITTGTGAGMFSPNATVTRAQVVTFLYRLSGAQVTAKEIFRDVAPEAYYAAAVTWAQEQGITTGTGAETFSPDAPCTRAQIITFLYRYFKQQ